ncbi:MAG: phosphatase PAP2 family protein [Sphingomicrobium sp.]
MIETRELRATLVGAAAVAAYLLAVLASDQVHAGQFALLFLAYVGGSFALWLVVGIAFMFVQLFRHARRSGSEPFLAALVKGAVAARWERDRGASLIWPPLLFATLMASFNAFKQMILPLAGYGDDPLLAKADRLLFFGHDGWRVTHALFGSPQATAAIDQLYHGWFAPMAIGVIVCAWLPASTYRLRTQYLLTYIAVWIGIGSVLAFLLPSAGPCFYTRLVGPAPEFDGLMRRLAEIQAENGAPLVALRNQAMLMGAHGSDMLVMGGGISAMPSVHNGLAVLFALAGWQVSRPLGALFGAYAAVIWIGSIHLGWHYGLDGVVAAALTYGIWVVMGRVADRLERPLTASGAKPALA